MGKPTTRLFLARFPVCGRAITWCIRLFLAPPHCHTPGRHQSPGPPANSSRAAYCFVTRLTDIKYFTFVLLAVIFIGSLMIIWYAVRPLSNNTCITLLRSYVSMNYRRLTRLATDRHRQLGKLQYGCIIQTPTPKQMFETKIKPGEDIKRCRRCGGCHGMLATVMHRLGEPVMLPGRLVGNTGVTIKWQW